MTGITEEELCVVDIYRRRSRTVTAVLIQTGTVNVDDPEMRQLMRSAAAKLLKMTDAEYEKLPASMIG
ncbi:MAG: hypothetical protein IKE18_10460 [Oscillospiraceae bacterium]|nr:hypothetical protein [Oscillospiraceae bacterium]